MLGGALQCVLREQMDYVGKRVVADWGREVSRALIGRAVFSPLFCLPVKSCDLTRSLCCIETWHFSLPFFLGDKFQ